jgi:AcrR family transcriptional regulator
VRADGKRSRELIIAAAGELVARDGVQVSLEEVARRAGVGSATLHRHFGSRRDLLELLFRDGVARLCDRARSQPGKNPGAELSDWLEELTVYTAMNRGLPAALMAGPDGLTANEICCTEMVHDVLDVLVRRAAAAKSIQAHAQTRDLMLLTNAIGAATEKDAEAARRLLRLALDGILAPSAKKKH